MMISFWVDKEAIDQVNDSDLSYLNCDDTLNFKLDLPEDLVECLMPDELIEFVGIDSEFLINIEAD